MVAWSQKLTGAAWFQNAIMVVILLAAVLVGIETYPALVDAHGVWLHTLDKIVLGIFVAEILLKMVALTPRPQQFFRDPWNVFDFAIVAACFIPMLAQYAVVMRLLRLLRVLRLVRSIPKLQILVGALLKSVPSMMYVALLLLLLFYVYGVAGVFLFSQNDPFHFGTLQRSMLSLYRVVTMEGWTALMYTQLFGCAEFPFPVMPNGPTCTNPQPHPFVGPAFFVSFTLIGTMVVLNLFIGVIMNGMQEAQDEAEEAEEARRREQRGFEQVTLEHDLFVLTQQITALQEQVARVRRKTENRLGTPEDAITQASPSAAE